MAHTEQTCADLRRRDVDTRETVAAKDAQIAVLRTRLDEADRDLAIKTKQLTELGSTQDRCDVANYRLLLLISVTNIVPCQCQDLLCDSGAVE